MYGGMIWRKPETFKSLKILQQICLIIKISGPNSNYMKQNKIKQNKKSTEKKRHVYRWRYKQEVSFIMQKILLA